MTEISHLSTEYVKVPISATEAGLPVDPTAGTVTMAFTAIGSDPDVADWQTASWETDTTREPDRYFARCLVGPDGEIELAADTKWWVWWKITGISPEAPVGRGDGTLDVT